MVAQKTNFLVLLIAGVFTVSTSLVSCKAPNTPEKAAIAASSGIKTKVVRMGYMTAGDITRSRQVLEKRLNPLGIKIEWAKFTAGPQLLEAMNVGSLDVGAVGETPPIFAQVTGIPFVYIASTKPPTGEGTAIVVHKDSPIKTVADLKGKTLAFQRATASQYFVVKALQEAGLKLSDVKHLNLISPETRAAFIRRSIDAGVINDPQLAEFQRTVGVRILRDGKGITTQGGYWLAARSFVKDNPELVKIILEEVNNVGKWAEANPRDVAEIIGRDAKLDISTLEKVVRRRRYTLRPINDEILSGQQKIADLFYEQKFITKKINVKEAALSSEEYAAVTPSEIKP
ncbi:ABC transporter substrate-binding protein [Nostoc linckia z18]|jgi:sulfonate transport system substrate-binding protein|uniref:Aliphatic sulfonate ABC transporter substrate-binding protein n=3 Tax=Nostoc TaxID=1177 RepID=A0ABR8HK38_NOSPU|nr:MULTISPECIES: aliphatic sulfonate ABC transporter substrate-binding protein [Nostoc]MBL1201584.1 aliphatic sulfonate ABC transporter substrate-binding protein [Nostoc sp. GBBB01]MDZ8011667.1 aliphatic sulfonate ABC transporter substrate-binding protein [Nostoc sp. ZfuVER08]PHK28511.1 ABC transporter substrate-binding protein [Nostoc linckia z15]PHK48289.1 ABC transporter substrate-binding protein [Nostoc linckia z16]MBD2615751.1 aliphatic sulfonate ABC transporter substrate-binding protein 